MLLQWYWTTPNETDPLTLGLKFAYFKGKEKALEVGAHLFDWGKEIAGGVRTKTEL